MVRGRDREGRGGVGIGWPLRWDVTGEGNEIMEEMAISKTNWLVEKGKTWRNKVKRPKRRTKAKESGVGEN